MKHPDFEMFKNMLQMAFSDVKGFLHTTGDQIPFYIFKLSHGPPLGHTNGAHVEVELNLGVLCD
jgi:hypothetical protein